MALHRWTITQLDSGAVLRRGTRQSSYGDETLADVWDALTDLGVDGDGIAAIGADLDTRYGDTSRGGIEFNIRPGDNEHVEAVHGNYHLTITVDPHA
ncbi:Uncharacterised protein [Mycobacteroides abscessus subsp. abscessus]|uniref:hypothetical protein n=1 Tax=Mycobacteroides abscessus TaxID=36809 RepID=UPI000927B784|nr:hypothetical protein [Mycobacteroides abscessus]SHQ67557.1 Uncharacterised protein [Mycobacteroides abscessus subsp. abscessus]SHR91169.1 Uncharacterised protein [Mycobacteroides abscessus subsp. abscessus]SIH64322.1 Uncharacterised protein [Mycobacteroides abscessus subsp. abscessus]